MKVFFHFFPDILYPAKRGSDGARVKAIGEGTRGGGMATNGLFKRFCLGINGRLCPRPTERDPRCIRNSFPEYFSAFEI